MRVPAKAFLFAVSVALLTLTSCVETERPTDSGISGTGGPKDWEMGMPGMSSLMPENR